MTGRLFCASLKYPGVSQNYIIVSLILASLRLQSFLSKYNMKQYFSSQLIIFTFCCIGVILSGGIWEGNHENSDKNLLSLITRAAVATRDNALMAPPSGYQGRMPSYYIRTQRELKREPNWIWMPSHGYVPVPEPSNVRSSESRGSTILRYG
ncbi:Hypothetical predicted protein [Octopus vulgaris]|uniref:Uncharacterized protein n=2 Tax=Octopus vulgaris TaxID=6645 RepID=A0AA36F3J2_OCTVU|nr:Hypothetical predicted protein [Octopus vulgaris]